MEKIKNLRKSKKKHTKNLPKGINKQDHTNKRKQCNAQGSAKSLNRFYNVESMGIKTNSITANHNVEDIQKNI